METPNNNPSSQKPRLHPLMATAAISVIVLAAVGVTALVMNHSDAQPSPYGPPTAAETAPAPQPLAAQPTASEPAPVVAAPPSLSVHLGVPVFLHFAEQPSPSTRLPSSHCSPSDAWTTPSPQRGPSVQVLVHFP